jgi:hypothetical protein
MLVGDWRAVGDLEDPTSDCFFVFEIDTGFDLIVGFRGRVVVCFHRFCDVESSLGCLCGYRNAALRNCTSSVLLMTR